MTGVTLDAGALVAFEKNDRRMVVALRVALDALVPITIPSGVVGQVWRDGAHQARLARLLGSNGVVVEPLDDRRARAAGQLCGATGTKDVIDASVVLGARARGDRIFTSDVNDLRRLDARVPLERV
ncbi:MAG: PIN domain nuclease [Deltaproteobacteria bacterium]|nr:PIN domain nuclease [Deltaproteobacteria bacterium]